MRELALVALGAMPGAMLRWQSSVQLGPFLGGNAGADLLVNLVGSFILGFLAGPIPRRTSLLLLVGIGFCGSLTTFSSWMLDVAKLIQAGRSSSGLLLIAASLALGLLCALAGLWLSRRVFRRTAG
ncbi:MAG: fluoride efflux transporter FluC [Vulcanococcus sp.]